jgi:hypothetical protein
MLKILFFIIIFWIIVTSDMFRKIITDLAELIISINSSFFPYLPTELKLIILIVVFWSIYKLYLNFRH